MDLFTSLKSRTGVKRLQAVSKSGKESNIVSMIEKAYGRARKSFARLDSSKGYSVLYLEKYFHRQKWLSIQYYELGSLINQYLLILNAPNAQAKEKKLEQFLCSATRTLKRYKRPVYRSFNKSLSKRRKQTLSPTALQMAVDMIYDELRLINALYQRKLQWKRIRYGVKSLIRDSVRRS